MERAEEPSLRTVIFKTQKEAESYLSQVANSVRDVAFGRSGEPFQMAYAGGSIGRCSLHRGTHSTMNYAVEESGEIHVIVPLRSSLRFVSSAGALEAAAGRSALLLPPSASGAVSTSDQISGISLIVAEADIARSAANLIEPGQTQILEPGGPRRLELADPLADALGRNMSAVFHEMMTLGEAGIGPLASTSFDELLLHLMAATVSNRVRDSLAQARPSAGSTIVRRAQDYLRAHAADPGRLADLASRLGVGLRSLQLSFRREVGCSPREFLMRCRTEMARGRLLSAEPEATVVSIAFECGFTDLSHFSRRYRAVFGELPSTTLRRRSP